MSLTHQIYKEFDSNYILKKICVKAELIYQLLSACASSILITSSRPQYTPCLCMLSTIRLVLNIIELFSTNCAQWVHSLHITYFSKVLHLLPAPLILLSPLKSSKLVSDSSMSQTAQHHILCILTHLLSHDTT